MNIPIHFSDQGSGLPVILLHGFCENGHIWDGFSDELAKHFRVITPDLPGFGDSPLPPGPFSLDEVARQMHLWIDELCLPHSIIIGHSLGGYVALAMAKQKIDIFAGIGLFHSNAFADSDEKKANRDKAIAFVTKYGVKPFSITFVQSLFHDVGHKDLDWVAEMAASTAQNSLISYTRAMRDRASSEQFLRQLPVSLLVVAGKHDTIVPIETAKQVAALAPKAVFKELANAAHMGMLEDRKAALNGIIEFCNFCRLK